MVWGRPHTKSLDISGDGVPATPAPARQPQLLADHPPRLSQCVEAKAAAAAAEAKAQKRRFHQVTPEVREEKIGHVRQLLNPVGYTLKRAVETAGITEDFRARY